MVVENECGEPTGLAKQHMKFKKKYTDELNIALKFIQETIFLTVDFRRTKEEDE